MCGISAIIGTDWETSDLEAMVRSQMHRGPDHSAIYQDPENRLGLGHNRLSIIDLSSNANQPMSNARGDRWVCFNGEIYNYRELRTELSGYPFRTQSDTEVLLAAYDKWGEACLDRFFGMFAFVLWDEGERKLFAARDRFGVKPLYFGWRGASTLVLASEIRALFAAGIETVPDSEAWATYLCYGLYDHRARTFWKGIESLPPGHKLTYRNGCIETRRWYDLAERVGPEYDQRSEECVGEECLALLQESMRLRFRSDVPVGVNLSGGLDSSIALGLVNSLGGKENTTVFTYTTGDPRYDELPWVEEMLAATSHPLVVCELKPEDVPKLAASVQAHQSEPFGGLPTLAYANLLDCARSLGIIVLCDGQGLDEQWAGYEYYRQPAQVLTHGPVQGSRKAATRPDCLTDALTRQASRFNTPVPFPDALRNRQYFDICYAKIPRALRFNDRVSMRASTELREPFMDHRLFELAMRQPPDRKIRNGTSKWLLREATGDIVPSRVRQAPKRPVQTPQREWLRGPLRVWSLDCTEAALREYGGSWLNADAVNSAFREYSLGQLDNSFFLWQWISLGLMLFDFQTIRDQKRLWKMPEDTIIPSVESKILATGGAS
jgi:asparagine synthase (glutamine-hydrolysing)